ncbi:MAG: hypothetical protein ACOH2K_12105 [Burkholderiaceae bacterium]
MVIVQDFRGHELDSGTVHRFDLDLFFGFQSFAFGGVVERMN